MLQVKPLVEYGGRETPERVARMGAEEPEATDPQREVRYVAARLSVNNALITYAPSTEENVEIKDTRSSHVAAPSAPALLRLYDVLYCIKKYLWTIMCKIPLFRLRTCL